MTQTTHGPARPRRHAVALSALVTLAAAGALGTGAMAATRVFTLDADFDIGVLQGVDHRVANQLQLSLVGSTFPVMWIANGGEDTVSKIDTQANRELARYRTWFGPAGQAGHFNHLNNPFAGPAPSRTAVDLSGNAYVADRWFDGARPAWVLKILAEGGIDRNGNGVIDTSRDLNNDNQIGAGEILPMADLNNNGIIEPNEITDERIAWAVPVGPANGLGRSLCIGTDGNLWVGLYNLQQYYKISATNGAVLAGPISTAPSPGRPSVGAWTPYGCLVDGNGTLWSASLSGILGKIENAQLNPSPANPNPYVVSSFAHAGQNYGIALGNQRVFLGRVDNGAYAEFNPATNSFIYPAEVSFAATGISVDGNGNIVTGPYATGGVTKFRWSADNTGTCATNPAKNGCVLWSRPTQLGSETRGVIVDGGNDVWQVSRTGNAITKYRGSDGTPLGVYPVGNHPYTYSDATGFAATNVTNPIGTWNVVYDSATTDARWGTIGWNDSVPAGAAVQVEARAAATQAGLALAPYHAVTKGVQFDATGRFLQIQARLVAAPDRQSPVLFDLTASTLGGSCDIDGDADTDVNDVALVRAAIGSTPAPNDPRDVNRDGKLTVNDARACALLCTRPSCAAQ